MEVFALFAFCYGNKLFFKLGLFSLSKSKVTTQVPVVPIFNTFSNKMLVIRA